MGQASLLVHAVDNCLDNIDILLSEHNLQKEMDVLVGKIIKEQLNKILENAELYYLEDDNFAKNKENVFLLEFIQFICEKILQRYNEEKSTNFVFTTNYIEKKVKIKNNVKKIEKLLECLLSTELEEISTVQLNIENEEIYIKLNLQKIPEHSLQSK